LIGTISLGIGSGFSGVLAQTGSLTINFI
jgi:hypothetical protein